MAAEAGTNDAGSPNTGNRDAGSQGTGNQDAGNHNASRQDRSSSESNGTGTQNARQLAQDWISMWQSELTALAADPELRESWQALAAVWAGVMAAALQTSPRPGSRGTDERSAGSPRPAATAGAAPAAAAPDPRDAEIERLARHVAALERRLADLERNDPPAAAPSRNSRRKPRP
jgi:hypothetical protein